MNKNTKSVIQFIVLLGIGILLVWLSFKSVWTEKEKILDSFKAANYFWVGISILIAFFSHFLRAFRWNYLLNPAGYSVKTTNAVVAVLVGYFANYGLPRMGEVTRCTLISKYEKVPFEIAFGTVITERIIDTLILIIIFFLTLFAQFNQLKELTVVHIYNPMVLKLQNILSNTVGLISLVVIVLVITVGLFLLRKKMSGLWKGKLGNVIRGFGKGLSSVKDMEHKFQFIILSLAIWASYFYSLYVCFFAFTGTAELGHSECLVLLLFGTFGVVFSPGGLGAYPAIITALLMYYGIEQIAAFSFPWMAWTSQFILIVTLGLLSLILLPIINKTKSDVVS